MRVVFAGTPAVAVPSLQAILDSGRHDVVAVVTRPDKPAGRGRELRSSPVEDIATAQGIPLLQPRPPRDAAFRGSLRELAPDCCPVVAYGALLPSSALAVPARG